MTQTVYKRLKSIKREGKRKEGEKGGKGKGKRGKGKNHKQIVSEML